MGHQDVDRVGPEAAHGVHGCDEGRAGRADVIDKDHLAAGDVEAGGQRKGHVAVAPPFLGEDGMSRPTLGGDGRGPRRGLRVRADHQRLAMTVDGVGEELGDGKHAHRTAEHRLQVVGAVQVRLDGDDPIEPRPDQPPQHVAAQGLPRLENLVLAQVGHVGRDQHQSPRAGAPQGVGRQAQGHQLVVRSGEGSVEESRLMSRRHRRQGLAVRKAMQMDRVQRELQLIGQPLGRRTVLLEGEDRGAHGAIRTPLSMPAASTAKPKSEGSDPRMR